MFANLATWWTAIVVLVAIFICPHMHMSWADVKGSIHGAFALIATALVASLATVVIPEEVVWQIQGAMNTFVTYYIYALVLGLIMSVIMTIIGGVMSIVKGKGL
jgi:H+/gluconate symporter-like permease